TARASSRSTGSATGRRKGCSNRPESWSTTCTGSATSRPITRPIATRGGSPPPRRCAAWGAPHKRDSYLIHRRDALLSQRCDPFDEAEELLKHRFAEINLWRPIRGPLLRSPLALCDAQTLSEENLVASDLRYPDRTG